MYYGHCYQPAVSLDGACVAGPISVLEWGGKAVRSGLMTGNGVIGFLHPRKELAVG